MRALFPRCRWESLRLAWLILASLATVALLPPEVLAHGALRSSDPANGAQLSELPRQLRLTFTESVELSLARLTLTGPGGVVQLTPRLSLSPDSGNVLIGGIEGHLLPGPYIVAWQVTGADGHPVRGEYSFAILSDATGLRTTPAEPEVPPAIPAPAAHHDPRTFPSRRGFDAESPLYAFVRWLNFLGILGVIGVGVFRAVLSSARRVYPGSMESFTEPATRRAARLGLGVAILTTLAALLRLFAQTYALNDSSAPPPLALVTAVLTRTTWGWGWILQAAGATLCLAGFSMVLRGAAHSSDPSAGQHRQGIDDGRGWVVAALGAVVLAVAMGMSGHAAAAATLAPVPVVLDAVHILGAGGWLGGLLVIVVAGLPAALRLPAADRGGAIAALVNAFSPVALLLAAAVVATGIFASWLHLPGISELWQSAYGQILLLKLVLLSALFATGAYNWLRVKPALGDEVAAGRLRRSAMIELAIGALVLLVTAFLVATPPPV